MAVALATIAMRSHSERILATVVDEVTINETNAAMSVPRARAITKITTAAAIAVAAVGQAATAKENPLAGNTATVTRDIAAMTSVTIATRDNRDNKPQYY